MCDCLSGSRAGHAEMSYLRLERTTQNTEKWLTELRKQAKRSSRSEWTEWQCADKTEFGLRVCFSIPHMVHCSSQHAQWTHCTGQVLVKNMCITRNTGKLSLIEQHAIYAAKLLNQEKQRKAKR